ncbi:unnamed protein product [Didymodactylos carnosus]|uniref:EF-hand domain-containing protein n=1 Tax=Didymodactylos carnosus TaxID=1234261 RepID=A0A814K7Y7_9BILA|nr:unnamed protein product [Didymodactylos carnosus]CAF1048871.1 unnamed protein product [Didymodactylos carnosus]CAF3667670.1 unnamed protein product [Didymodactylos carnosus]CAF3818520.1 unnamed protein product [Didymodactylos carnosus]
MTQLLETFRLFDSNDDGFISFDELRNAWHRLCIPINDDELRTIVERISSKKNECRISFDDFQTLMLSYQTKQTKRKNDKTAYLDETFQAFDKNRDNYISAEEVCQTMQQLGENLTLEEAKAMVKLADRNQDGKLSKDEFAELLQNLQNNSISP